ncbi:hypothetical protein CBL_01418 [Carabus blaptoides fortunei]
MVGSGGGRGLSFCRPKANAVSGPAAAVAAISTDLITRGTKIGWLESCHVDPYTHFERRSHRPAATCRRRWTKPEKASIAAAAFQLGDASLTGRREEGDKNRDGGLHTTPNLTDSYIPEFNFLERPVRRANGSLSSFISFTALKNAEISNRQPCIYLTVVPHQQSLNNEELSRTEAIGRRAAFNTNCH